MTTLLLALALTQDVDHARIAREMQASLDGMAPALQDFVVRTAIARREHLACLARRHWYTPWRRCR